MKYCGTRLIWIYLKQCVTLHFTKCMYVTENRMTKLLSHEMKQLVKVHTVNRLPNIWQLFVMNKTRELQLQFRNDNEKL